MQDAPQPQQMPESYLDRPAFRNALSEATAKQYHIPESCEQEWIDCHKKFQELYFELDRNIAYKEELLHLQQRFPDWSSLEFLEAYEELRAKFSPELIQVDRELRSWTSSSVDENRDQMMAQEFAAVFQKYSDISAASQEAINNPDYQRDVQAATEKYGCTKNEEEYLKDLNDIQCKYIPETQMLEAELKAISEKYKKL